MASQAQKILNRINRDMIDMNFVEQHYPKLTLSSINTTELLQELEIDKGLNAMGIDLSREEIYDRYGRTPPESPDDVLAGKPPGTACAWAVDSWRLAVRRCRRLGGGPAHALSTSCKSRSVMARSEGFSMASGYR